MVKKLTKVDAISGLDDSGANSPRFARTLGKGLEILRCFSAGDKYLGNKEIAERVGLPKQTVSRLTYTLVALGYLAYSETRSQYRLSSGVLTIAYPLLSGLILRQALRPLMAELAKEVRGSVSLGTRHRDRMIYLESFNAPDSPNHVAELGSLIPIHDTAMGKAYLASAEPTERALVLSRIARNPAAARKLDQEIGVAAEELRTRGFCLWSGARHVRTAVALPLCRAIDGERLIVNCGLSTLTATPERMANEIGPRLVSVVHTFESTLGLR